MQQRVEDEGASLGEQLNKSQKECEAICDNTENCKSFSYNLEKQKCWLFDRDLTGNEPQIEWMDYYTVYKNCGKYWVRYGIDIPLSLIHI